MGTGGSEGGIVVLTKRSGFVNDADGFCPGSSVSARQIFKQKDGESLLTQWTSISIFFWTLL